jgi:hypothetical protein
VTLSGEQVVKRGPRSNRRKGHVSSHGRNCK